MNVSTKVVGSAQLVEVTGAVRVVVDGGRVVVDGDTSPSTPPELRRIDAEIEETMRAMHDRPGAQEVHLDVGEKPPEGMGPCARCSHRVAHFAEGCQAPGRYSRGPCGCKIYVVPSDRRPIPKEPLCPQCGKEPAGDSPGECGEACRARDAAWYAGWCAAMEKFETGTPASVALADARAVVALLRELDLFLGDVALPGEMIAPLIVAIDTVKRAGYGRSASEEPEATAPPSAPAASTPAPPSAPSAPVVLTVDRALELLGLAVPDAHLPTSQEAVDEVATLGAGLNPKELKVSTLSAIRMALRRIDRFTGLRFDPPVNIFANDDQKAAEVDFIAGAVALRDAALEGQGKLKPEINTAQGFRKKGDPEATLADVVEKRLAPMLNGCKVCGKNVRSRKLCYGHLKELQAYERRVPNDLRLRVAHLEVTMAEALEAVGH